MLRTTTVRRFSLATGLMGAGALALVAAAYGDGIDRWWEWIAFVLSLGLFSAGVIVALGDVEPVVFAVIAGAALPAFLLGVILHNLVSALIGVEEPVFFLVAIVGAPQLLVAGVAGLLRAAGRDLWGQLRVRQRQREGAAPRSS